MQLTSSYKVVDTIVQAYDTGGNAKFAYDWSNTNSYQAQAMGQYSGGTAKAALGLEWLTQNTTDAGVSYTWPTNSDKGLWVETRYRLWKEMCFSSNNIANPTGYEEWNPYRFDGGSTVSNSTQTFSCSSANISSMAVTTWVSRTASTTWGNWFSLNGVSLDAKATNTSSDKLTIIPQGGRTAKICGSNDKPLYASKVKEVS